MFDGIVTAKCLVQSRNWVRVFSFLWIVATFSVLGSLLLLLQRKLGSVLLKVRNSQSALVLPINPRMLVSHPASLTFSLIFLFLLILINDPPKDWLLQSSGENKVSEFKNLPLTRVIPGMPLVLCLLPQPAIWFCLSLTQSTTCPCFLGSAQSPAATTSSPAGLTTRPTVCGGWAIAASPKVQSPQISHWSHLMFFKIRTHFPS